MRQNVSARHLAFSAFLFVAMSMGTAAAGPSDAWLTTRIKVALFTGTGVSTMDVNVDTVRGNVTLHGRVESQEHRARAEEVVRKVDGVRGVRNLLQVVPERRELVINADDKVIKRRLERALKQDPALADSRIEVKSVNNGVVLVGGEATSLDDHLRAVEHARRVPGVTEVASEIKSPDRMGDGEIWHRHARDRAASRRSVGDVSSDLWITSDVKMRLLADGATPAMDINVDTRGGVVTLFGTVPDQEAKQAAELDARKVDGVKRVVNALEVVPREAREAIETSDKDIQADVEKSLKGDGDLDDASIDVDVQDGIVRLTGTVNSDDDRLLAAIHARSASGVRSVRDDLRVEPRKAQK